MPIYTLPDLDTNPLGAQYDFQVGADGRQGGAFPVIEVQTFKPADGINIAGVIGTNVTAKIPGSCLRLICISADGTPQWQPQYLTGPWELT